VSHPTRRGAGPAAADPLPVPHGPPRHFPNTVSSPGRRAAVYSEGSTPAGGAAVTAASALRRILAADLASEPDAALLARFAAGRDEAAFAALYDRHGPMVRAVCRRHCRDPHLAADAEQGVWLVLARRAAAVARPDRLANWLFGVAVRVGRKAAASAAAPPQPPAAPAFAPDTSVSVLADELLRVLDEELAALPEAERLPLVLCYLQGRTQDEAARVCGTCVRTLRRRLERGRAALRRRLERRGVAPAAALGALAVAPAAAPASPRVLAAALAGGPVPSSLSPWVAEELAMSGTSAWWLRVVVVTGLALGGAATAAWSSADAPAPPAPSAPPPPAPAAPAEPLPEGVVARFGGSRYQAPGDIFFSALSPDGRLLALTGGNPVWVYEAATWRLVRKLDAADQKQGVWPNGHNFTFSPDGRYIGYAKNGRSAYVWDLTTGKLTARFDSGDDWGWTAFAAFTPNGRLALSDKERLRFFDPATGREVRSLPAGRVVALSPDGKVFVRWVNHDQARTDQPTELVFGDAATVRELHRTNTLVRFGLGRSSLAYSPDGRSLAVIPPGAEEVQIWDAVGREKKATLRPAAKVGETALGGADVGYTPDGKTVWAYLSNRSLARWEATTGKPLPPLEAGRGPMFYSLYPLPDGKTVLTPVSGVVRVWDAGTLRERDFPDRFRMFSCSALSPDAAVLAVGDSSGKIGLFDAVTGRLARIVREAGEPVRWLTFSPDRELLAVGEHAGIPRDGSPLTVRVLRVSDGKERWSLERKRDESRRLTSLVPLGFAGDADRLIISHYIQDARVWNLATGTETPTLPVKSFHAVPSPDGKLLATDEPGGIAVLLDTATGREVRRIATDPEDKLRRRGRGIELFAWSGDGRTLAMTLPEDHVAILDPEAGKEVRRFRAYTGEAPADFSLTWRGDHSVRGMSLSGDGKRLAASVLNGWYVAVWDTTTGKEVARLKHDFQVDSATLTPDGKAVITFSLYGTGYRWDLDALAAPKK